MKIGKLIQITFLGSVKSFLYFNLLEVLKTKVEKPKADIFEEYLNMINENVTTSANVCPKETITLSQDFEWIFSYENLNDSEETLTWKDLLNEHDMKVKWCHMKRNWNVQKKDSRECYIPKSEEMRNQWLSRCKPEVSINPSLIKEVFVVYRVLRMIEAVTLPGNAIQLLIGITKHVLLNMLLKAMFQIFGNIMTCG